MGLNAPNSYMWVWGIEKGIRIEYPYNFGLPLGNSAFVTIWLEFDLWSVQLYKSKGNTRSGRQTVESEPESCQGTFNLSKPWVWALYSYSFLYSLRQGCGSTHDEKPRSGLIWQKKNCKIVTCQNIWDITNSL